MTELVIGLIPTYGLFIIFGVVSLACLAVPLPSSMLVLAAGAFAASGDLVLWQVVVTAFAGFVIGDQLAFGIAHRLGPRILGMMRKRQSLVPVLDKSEKLIDQRGPVAVLLSHTVLSPTCPYVSYLCGAGGMRWPAFAGMATLGAAIWASAYVLLGYVFATQLTQVANVLSQFFGLIFALIGVVICGKWLRSRWAAAQRDFQGN